MGYEKQVAAGIAFLDEDVPGWRADLDIKTVRQAQSGMGGRSWI